MGLSPTQNLLGSARYVILDRLNYPLLSVLSLAQNCNSLETLLDMHTQVQEDEHPLLLLNRTCLVDFHHATQQSHH